MARRPVPDIPHPPSNVMTSTVTITRAKGPDCPDYGCRRISIKATHSVAIEGQPRATPTNVLRAAELYKLLGVVSYNRTPSRL